jgi:choline dehydrogenase
MDTMYHRSSAYDNYYMQAKGRSNLKVLTFSPVRQLILNQEGEKVVASGVVYTDYASGQILNATAKEVILSAGTFHTPQLLMLSVSSINVFLYHSHLTKSGYRSNADT